MFCQAVDHADALQLLQTELGVLARDASFNLRIVAAAAAHSAASAGLLQCFKDHCLPFLLVNKADKVCCARACALFVAFDACGGQVRNVRLRVAGVFALLVRMGEPWCSLGGVQSSVAELRADADAEVRLCIC